MKIADELSFFLQRYSLHNLRDFYAFQLLAAFQTLESMYYGLSFAFNTILFLLTIVRARKDFGLRKLFRNENFSPILTSIVRDGTLYFCLLLVATFFLLFVSLNIVTSASSFGLFISLMYP
ncbi:hypothetical protein BDQ17DRAFT_195827 [Cyathus striatus]|nr:hypothetical protein BDQ17DRAFT_195827 [Cyathus striatus]